MSQLCNPNNPNIGISQIRIFDSNDGSTATLVIDNISNEAFIDPCLAPLPFCAADIYPATGDGVVNVDDLIQGVINTWGQTQVPQGTGMRPLGDCAPAPGGDCEVNIDDLLAIINAWGPCD